MSLCVFREKKRRSQEGCIVLTPLVVSTLGLAAPISSEPFLARSHQCGLLQLLSSIKALPPTATRGQQAGQHCCCLCFFGLLVSHGFWEHEPQACGFFSGDASPNPIFVPST